LSNRKENFFFVDTAKSGCYNEPKDIPEGGLRMKDIHLLGKRVLADRSRVLLHYEPAEDWLTYWQPMCGEWEYKDGAIIGTEPRDTAALLFSREYFKQNVMLSFTVSAVLPAPAILTPFFAPNGTKKRAGLGILTCAASTAGTTARVAWSATQATAQTFTPPPRFTSTFRAARCV
jgi:hypothetical protein